MLTYDDFSDPSRTIFGVELKKLTTYPDQRGFFREVIRFNDPIFSPPASTTNKKAPAPGPEQFAQWSHSRMARDTVKAWHFHHLQTDWWYVAIGTIEVALVDWREESPTFRRKIQFVLGGEAGSYGTGSSEVLAAALKIPPGVLHGGKVTSDEAHLLYVTSMTYDPTDEGRIPFNSPAVDHSWGDESKLIVAPNDRREHIPPHRRALVA